MSLLSYPGHVSDFLVVRRTQAETIQLSRVGSESTTRDTCLSLDRRSSEDTRTDDVKDSRLGQKSRDLKYGRNRDLSGVVVRHKRRSDPDPS